MRPMRGGGRLGGGRHGCGGSSRGGGLHVRTPHRSMRPPPRSLPYSGEFAALGLTPFASRNDVKHAYKRLALKYHPDVLRRESMQDKEETFKEIKSAYENLMVKFEEESTPTMASCDDEWEEWDKWMGFEGGIPIIYNPS